jgi:hypothetical protein
MFRNPSKDYLIVAVVSTVLVESPVRQVLSAQMLSHTVESEALVSVLLLLQAAKDRVATAIKEKINFFIRLLLTVFFKKIITPCYYC